MTANQWADYIRRNGEKRTNSYGDTFYHLFRCDDERYRFDFAENRGAEGWEQYDTDQDAPYFGVWTNKNRLQTLSFCEGDWNLNVYPTVASYNNGIKQMNEFYDPGFIAKSIEPDGKVTRYEQDHSEFFIPA